MGRRVAFDSVRGRLWVVCRSCERWNLSALDERLDAIDECERLFEKTRRRVSTDNIGLARLTDGLELVRIGKPLRGEFAAWRYGDQFGRRRRRNVLAGSALAVVGGTAAIGALLVSATVGGAYWAYLAGDRAMRRAKEKKLIARIPTEGGQTITVLGEHLAGVKVAPTKGDQMGWTIEVPHVRGSNVLGGQCASHAASLLMPAINKLGGTQSIVERAVRRLENFEDPATYMLSAAAQSIHSAHPGGSVAKLPADVRLAIEMAVNEESERNAFEGDMWLLEHAWRQAEELAAIADNLTVTTDIDIKLLELRRKQANREGNLPTTHPHTPLPIRLSPREDDHNTAAEVSLPGKPSEAEEEYFARLEFDKLKKAEAAKREKLEAEEKEKLKELHHMCCPKCGMQLIEIDYRGIAVDKCSACDGVWLDAGELEQVCSLDQNKLLMWFGVFKR